MAAGALGRNTEGHFNTAIGHAALNSNTTGSSNIAVGVNAGAGLTTGDNNIDIGNDGVADEANTIRIGTDSQTTCSPTPTPTATPVPTRTFIAGITGTAVVGDAVVVACNGQLGTVASAARFKKNIKPVTFHYKSDNTNTPQFGLIAEEVAEVNPDLVVRDRNGDIYSVRYDAVNAMLLNEFLKEHRKVQEQDCKLKEQEATIAQQQRGMEAVTARLNEQASQIQKVSAQLEATSPSRGGLEASKFATGRIRGGGPAPQVVNNP